MTSQTKFGYDLMKAMEQAKDIVQQPVKRNSSFYLVKRPSGYFYFYASGAEEAKKIARNNPLFVEVK